MSSTPTVSQDIYGWDWTATTHSVGRNKETLVRDLLADLGTVHALPGKGAQGWVQSLVGYDADGYKLGAVYFGGRQDDVHVLSTSGVADQVHSVAAQREHARVARVDTRVDTLTPFEDLAEIVEEAASAYGTTTMYVESKKQGVSTGRTIYMGAASSAIRVRMYEKHLESPGQYVDGTNRVEVQLRPPSRVKESVATWSRMETFCCSRTTSRLAELLGDTAAKPGTLHVKRRTPDIESALEHMGHQYRSSVAKFLSTSGQGDLSKVLAYLIP